jgi:hypothetical protein
MAGEEAISGGAMPPDLLDPPWFERLWPCVRVAMGQVEDPGRDLGGCSVRGHVRQPDGGGRDRRRDREVKDDLRDAEDLDRRLEGLRGVRRAERLVGSEVASESVGRSAGAP